MIKAMLSKYKNVHKELNSNALFKGKIGTFNSCLLSEIISIEICTLLCGYLGNINLVAR